MNKNKRRSQIVDGIIKEMAPQVRKTFKLMQVGGMTAKECRQWNRKRRAAAKIWAK